MAKRKHPEEDLQIACNQMALILSKQMKFYWFHVPNGGNRSVTEAVKFKRMGVKAGVSDFIIMIPDRPWGCIELKAPGGSLSQKQKSFLEMADSMGCPTAVVKSVDEFQDTIKKMLQRT